MRRHFPWVVLGLFILTMLIVQFIPADDRGGDGRVGGGEGDSRDGTGARSATNDAAPADDRP